MIKISPKFIKLSYYYFVFSKNKKNKKKFKLNTLFTYFINTMIISYIFNVNINKTEAINLQNDLFLNLLIKNYYIYIYNIYEIFSEKIKHQYFDFVENITGRNIFILNKHFNNKIINQIIKQKDFNKKFIINKNIEDIFIKYNKIGNNFFYYYGHKFLNEFLFEKDQGNFYFIFRLKKKNLFITAGIKYNKTIKIFFTGSAGRLGYNGSKKKTPVAITRLLRFFFKKFNKYLKENIEYTDKNYFNKRFLIFRFDNLMNKQFYNEISRNYINMRVPFFKICFIDNFKNSHGKIPTLRKSKRK